MGTSKGFTIVELVVIISVLGIIAGLVIFGFSGWQRSIAHNAVKSDVQQATSSLESYRNFKQDYPPNLSGTNFAASDEVALTLRTNAPQTRSYTNLTPDQNAQLFINTCNALMPIKSADNQSTLTTACVFSGNNIHIKGQVASNTVFNGPTVNETDVQLNCGSTCASAISTIKQQFLLQNGSFPITVPKSQVSLPPYEITSYGSSTKYCLEGISSRFSDIIYHTRNTDKTVTVGPCPSDPELHYP